MTNREHLQLRQDSGDVMPPDHATDHSARYGAFFRFLSFLGIACMAALAIYCLVYFAWK
ncbi:hypothetical protein [Cohnella terricola]|uniref:hypothetical protein n=1 Tax=Cohnella terricola TaxID=1289167 RepID=UPI0016479E41|nr:hypothetical protein [Cohnella terricola]